MDWYEPLESISGVDEHDEDAWIAAGFAALERYLARHAAFDAWCADHLRRYGREPGWPGDDRRRRPRQGRHIAARSAPRRRNDQRRPGFLVCQPRERVGERARLVSHGG
jgi:hypothetical protein